MKDANILSVFCEEFQEELRTWELECLKLENTSEPPSFDHLFRIAHNMKGAAKMVGLNPLGNFIHQIEDVINLLRGGLGLSQQHIDLFLAAQSLLTDWVNNLEEDPGFIGDTESIAKQAALFVSQSQGPPIAASATPPNTYMPIDPATAPKTMIHWDCDLTIQNLKKIMALYRFKPGQAYLISLDFEQIDTAGAQMLLAIKKSKDFHAEFICTNLDVLGTFYDLGLGDILT